jgi:hypothetical protein
VCPERRGREEVERERQWADTHRGVEEMGEKSRT